MNNRPDIARIPFHPLIGDLLRRRNCRPQLGVPGNGCVENRQMPVRREPPQYCLGGFFFAFLDWEDPPVAAKKRLKLRFGRIPNEFQKRAILGLITSAAVFLASIAGQEIQFVSRASAAHVENALQFLLFLFLYCLANLAILSVFFTALRQRRNSEQRSSI